MLLLLLLLLVILILISYYFYIKPQRYWKDRNVPYEPSVPFFGDALRTILKTEHLTTTLDRLYRKHSNAKYFGYLNFSTPILIVKDEELIKKIMIKDFDSFPIHNFFVDEDIDPMWSKNLFSMQDVQKWRKLRTTLTPNFTANKMRIMYDLMQRCALNFADYFIQQNEQIIEVEVQSIYRRFANDVIASTAFGINIDSLKDRNNMFYVKGTKLSDLGGVIKLFLITSARTISKALKIRIIDENDTNFFRNIIKDNIRSREEQGIYRPDMIQLLLEARKGKLKNDYYQNEGVNNKKECRNFAEVEESNTTNNDTNTMMDITDDDITAQAIVFFIAGFDTSSSVMSFATAELAINPEIQEKLAGEVSNVYEKSNGCPSYEDIQHMKYLDMVISETLRKWNPSVFIDREATKPYVIQRDNEEPLRINKGDTIWVPAFSMQVDPKYYPEPEKFDPDRFSDGRKHEINPISFMPFGIGPRNCIGSRFALLECKVGLFHILANFEIVITNGTTLPIKLNKNQFLPQINAGFTIGFKRRKMSHII